MTRTHPRVRGFATAAKDDGKLPLKGYKVLDMTRVLAGVSPIINGLRKAAEIFISHIVRKSSVI